MKLVVNELECLYRTKEKSCPSIFFECCVWCSCFLHKEKVLKQMIENHHKKTGRDNYAGNFKQV